jgi:DNA repair protein RecO (recombination protein O)
MGERQRADHQRAFVLHTYPYSESSLIVEAFTRMHGRVVVIAKGARRPRGAMRGVLAAFQPLALSWSGRSEVRTLVRAEWLGGHPLPHGAALLCGFYLNELLLRLLARDDPHEMLFEHYAHAIERLATGVPLGPCLRWFEKRLLQELGYAMRLSSTIDGADIEPDSLYTFQPDAGAIRTAAGVVTEADVMVVHGKTLVDLHQDDYSDPRSHLEAKQLMRSLIQHRLENRPMLSRQIFRELQNL